MLTLTDIRKRYLNVLAPQPFLTSLFIFIMSLGYRGQQASDFSWELLIVWEEEKDGIEYKFNWFFKLRGACYVEVVLKAHDKWIVEDNNFNKNMSLIIK